MTSHHGRSLLWATEQESSALQDTIGTFNTSEAGVKSETVSSQKSICPMYINKTESLRQVIINIADKYFGTVSTTTR